MSKGYVEGTEALMHQLRALANPKEQAATLRAAVRTPMNAVKRRALVNIASLSPGKRMLHRTYKGRLVSSGFAARSVRLIVRMSRDKQSATAILGVRAEAFYALQFHELGTAYIPKNPWLLPAFLASKDEKVKGVANTMKKRIDRIAAMRQAQGRLSPGG